jgi:hypothetical protein
MVPAVRPEPVNASEEYSNARHVAPGGQLFIDRIGQGPGELVELGEVAGEVRVASFEDSPKLPALNAVRHVVALLVADLQPRSGGSRG